MFRRRPTTESRLARAVLLLAAVSVLAMPVSYTGGRNVSHPHAFVQLLFDAARGSTNHHRATTHHVHTEPVAREFFLLDVPDDTPVVSPTGGSIERVALVSMALTAGIFLNLGRLPGIESAWARLAGRTFGPDLPPPRGCAGH